MRERGTFRSMHPPPPTIPRHRSLRLAAPANRRSDTNQRNQRSRGGGRLCSASRIIRGQRLALIPAASSAMRVLFKLTHASTLSARAPCNCIIRECICLLKALARSGHFFELRDGTDAASITQELTGHFCRQISAIPIGDLPCNRRSFRSSL